MEQRRSLGLAWRVSCQYPCSSIRQEVVVAYQLLMLNPVIQLAIWIMTSLPRLLILLVSLCQTCVMLMNNVHPCESMRSRLTPAVAVFMPVPNPATTLPTII